MAVQLGRKNVNVNVYRKQSQTMMTLSLLLLGAFAPLAPSASAQQTTTSSLPSTAATANPSVADDPCYDPVTGQAIKCVTDFINAAFGETMTASGQCGVNGRENICRTSRDRSGRLQRQCSACESRNVRMNHGPQALTDLHNPNNATCWISQKLERNDENVTLELALNKKYELTYISVQFCSVRPDSVVILKSVDFGRVWTPFQFYSSQCRKLFNRSPRALATRSNEQEALCTQITNGPNEDPTSTNRIAFSTLEGRPSAYTVEESPILQDWMTATNIRIVMLRLRPTQEENALDSELTRDSMVYAVSDVAVGGRCKCNGHASRCKRNQQNKLVCDCRHNTIGDDCEKCRPFYQDRPWARAVVKNANECQKCNCNMHAKQCRFNKDLYLQSGKESGGVCLKCKHHTAGRHCHFCAEGYYRDWTKPITHRKACRPCECHPVGAADSLCNQTTGQCRCKEGVMGTACDRCLPGYQQSRSPSSPCVRLQTVSPSLEEHQVKPRNCGTCASGRKVNLKKYCEGDFAIHVHMIGQEMGSEWTKLTLNVMNIIKKEGNRIKRQHMEFYVRNRDFACDCPKARMFKQFLVISTYKTDPQVEGLVLDQSSIMVPWKDEWLQRLRKFQREVRGGKCEEVDESRLLLK